MHGHVPYDVFLQQISGFLGSYCLFLSIANAVAAYLIWRSGKDRKFFYVPVLELPLTTAGLWLLVSLFFLLISPFAYSGDPDWMAVISVPKPIQSGINYIMNPTMYSVGSLVVLLVLFWFRKIVVQPWVAWALLNLSLLL